MINQVEFLAIRQRTLTVLSELHRFRHLSLTSPVYFPDSFLAQNVQMTPESIATYVQTKLDRERSKVVDFLDGRRRLYELIDVEVEEEFLRLMQEDLERIGESITDLLLDRYTREAIEQFFT